MLSGVNMVNVSVLQKNYQHTYVDITTHGLHQLKTMNIILSIIGTQYIDENYWNSEDTC